MVYILHKDVCVSFHVRQFRDGCVVGNKEIWLFFGVEDGVLLFGFGFSCVRYICVLAVYSMYECLTNGGI